MSKFPVDTHIGKYTILSCIKENEFASSYLADEPIATRHLEDSIRANASSLSPNQTRRRIGFNV